MKSLAYTFTLLLALITLSWACQNTEGSTENPAVETSTAEVVPVVEPVVKAGVPRAADVRTDEIGWMSWDEAVAAHQQNPKMVFIDVYTDWCGWCKVMDKKTFTDPQVIQYINQHFYPVKFNAENEPNITFQGQEFKVIQGGRRGIHTLAYALLEGKMSYPAYVFLNSDLKRVNISRGFQPADQFMAELQKVTTTYAQ